MVLVAVSLPNGAYSLFLEYVTDSSIPRAPPVSSILLAYL